jgi:hypothetical protein
MIESENASEAEGKGDFFGALKMAGVIVIGVLAVVGLSWTDLLGFSDKSAPKNNTTKTEAETIKKEEGEEVADYNETYLEGDISEGDYSNVPVK